MEGTLEKQFEVDSIRTGDSTRFFRKLDWSAFSTACIASFVVYFFTLAPTVSLEDSGELATAGYSLGVPHPPGYPIWSFLAWIFTKVFLFVQYRGQPNPAWAIGLMSAVFGSLAAGITAMLICRSGSDLLRELRRTAHVAHLANENAICWIGGVVGSLVFAFSPVMWSQSVIAEVYSLNAFFLVLIFLLTYEWLCRPNDKLLCLTAFVFGLGLTNYQVLLLAALPLVFAIFLRDPKLFRDFLITGIPFVLTIALVKRGILPDIRHPLDITCYVYIGLNFLALLLAYFLLPRGKTVAIVFLLTELGVAFYGYMPIVSDLRNPPMNWGYPRTWEGFKHAITRGQYERISPTDIFSLRFIHQVGSYLTDLRAQFTLPVALLGFLPFTVWTVNFKGRKIKALNVAIALSVLASVMVVVERIIFRTPGPISFTYKIPSALVIMMLLAGALAILLTPGRELIFRLTGKTRATVSERITVGAVLLGLVGLFMFYAVMLVGKIVEINQPLRQAGASPTGEQIRDALLQSGGLVLLIIGPIILVSLFVWIMHSRHKFEVIIDLNSQRWIIATLLGFLTMSIMLIVLANPKGDIQDDFIQRVKFISSHALYAFWIGYGLVFGLAFVGSMARNFPAVRWLSLTIAMAGCLVPLHQNMSNKELLRKSGGAEQNAHDFGWQFGNYQLRGAEAISEELSADEEPLPNPRYPRAMGRNAVFFGGTDPGRFVPTYMIYAAKVREDVYLITQNALADNTFMNVTRDLYGDQIWIPAQTDSAKAFQRYVEEVKAGKRPKNAQLKIENGRVQVSGALGVMEINGILAQMIFEHNNYRHDFYVEESYVIPWMYPYMEPHGLIMKINAKKGRIPPDVIRDDLDFWDWHTRRMNGDTRFLRDIVARKSFSKLRSAIAGLYANTGFFNEAEAAFQQARVLYPLSPEANFRLAQEVFMRKGRIDDTRYLMKDFMKRDPGNSKTKPFLAQLDRIVNLNERIRELEQKRTKSRLEINTALQLLDLYLQAQRMGNFMGMAQSIMGNTNLPPEVFYRLATMYRKAKRTKEMARALDLCAGRLPPRIPPSIHLDIARMYASAGQPAKMLGSLQNYLRTNPSDWKAWLDMAKVQLMLKNQKAAIRSLQQAVAVGGTEANTVIAKDPQLAPVLNQIQGGLQPDLMRLPGVMPRG